MCVFVKEVEMYGSAIMIKVLPSREVPRKPCVDVRRY